MLWTCFGQVLHSTKTRRSGFVRSPLHALGCWVFCSPWARGLVKDVPEALVSPWAGAGAGAASQKQTASSPLAVPAVLSTVWIPWQAKYLSLGANLLAEDNQCREMSVNITTLMELSGLHPGCSGIGNLLATSRLSCRWVWNQRALGAFCCHRLVLRAVGLLQLVPLH